LVVDRVLESRLPIRGRSSFRLVFKPRGVKARVVAEVDVNATAQNAVIGERGPASAGDGITFVVALPREFNGWSALARRLSIVHARFDGDERESPGLVRADLDEGGAYEVEIAIPEFHLDDAPLPRDTRLVANSSRR
jgi:hypothetical protein